MPRDHTEKAGSAEKPGPARGGQWDEIRDRPLTQAYQRPGQQVFQCLTLQINIEAALGAGGPSSASDAEAVWF